MSVSGTEEQEHCLCDTAPAMVGRLRRGEGEGGGQTVEWECAEMHLCVCVCARLRWRTEEPRPRLSRPPRLAPLTVFTSDDGDSPVEEGKPAEPHRTLAMRAGRSTTWGPERDAGVPATTTTSVHHARPELQKFTRHVVEVNCSGDCVFAVLPAFEEEGESCNTTR